MPFFSLPCAVRRVHFSRLGGAEQKGPKELLLLSAKPASKQTAAVLCPSMFRNENHLPDTNLVVFTGQLARQINTIITSQCRM